MRFRNLIICFAATACAGHVAGSQMNARVLGDQGGNIAAPLSGAHLILNCPDGLTHDLGVTGSDGTVSLSPSLAPALDCNITVAETGYKPESYPVGQICAVRTANTCTAMDLRVVLHQAGSAGY